ncbi:MAG: DNA polymerase IV [Patescibacteria group bacterium]
MFPTLNKNTNLRQKNTKNRVILHIDYDSFFASVEQQANPFLRNKPIGITGSSLSRAIICAASKEAKVFGVKTGMPLFKAKELCPNILPVKGDGTKYTYIQKESLKIFNEYTDLIEPFSIDEAFLDITHILKNFESSKAIALDIKNKVKKKFGPYITCSIGIAPNKLIAKLVSDMEKPNGIVEVTQENLLSILEKASLRDFCGIGRQIEYRLNNLGVYSVCDLQNIDIETLYKAFGNVESAFLKNLSYGVDYSRVSKAEIKKAPKSIGHQHTLNKNTKDLQIIKRNLRKLSEMVARRLRRNKMAGKTISLYLRDASKKGYHQDFTIATYTEDGKVIYDTTVKILANMHWNRETRLVGVSISNLIKKKSLPLYLLPEYQRNEKLIKTSDLINNKFGEFTIVTADTLQADNTKGKISSFLKH